MVNPEIRRLQVLNDLIAQTLDVITQRSILTGGLSHSPFVPELGAGQVNPLAPYTGVNQGIGQLGINPWIGQQANPFAAPYGQVNPFIQGLSHTPFTGYPTQPAFTQFTSGVPSVSPWSLGLMHTPFNPGFAYGQYGQFPQQLGQQAFGQQVPFNPWMGAGVGAGRFVPGFGLPVPGFGLPYVG